MTCLLHNCTTGCGRRNSPRNLEATVSFWPFAQQNPADASSIAPAVHGHVPCASMDSLRLCSQQNPSQVRRTPLGADSCVSPSSRFYLHPLLQNGIRGWMERPTADEVSPNTAGPCSQFPTSRGICSRQAGLDVDGRSEEVEWLPNYSPFGCHD